MNGHEWRPNAYQRRPRASESGSKCRAGGRPMATQTRPKGDPKATQFRARPILVALLRGNLSLTPQKFTKGTKESSDTRGTSPEGTWPGRFSLGAMVDSESIWKISDQIAVFVQRFCSGFDEISGGEVFCRLGLHRFCTEWITKHNQKQPNTTG
jgi:hypothetical protein